MLNLRLELEEFSQLFETADKSTGLLRLRATVLRRSTGGETLLAQRSFIVQQNAPTADASGGVRALTAATDQAIAEIETWLAQVIPTAKNECWQTRQGAGGAQAGASYASLFEIGPALRATHTPEHYRHCQRRYYGHARPQ